MPTLIRALALSTLASLIGAAQAQLPLPAKTDFPLTGTLARIKETRSITLGVRESSRPFSFFNEQKQASGYSVELCMAAVEDIKKHLKLPELKVNYKMVQGAERIPKLLAGEIDLECGSTTNTKARQEKVTFSYTIFVAGMRVMTAKDTKIESVRDLAALPVALSKGTTSEKLFMQLNSSGETKMQITQFPNNSDAFKALREGKVKAFPQDDALLLGLASRDKVQNEMSLSSLALSVEPYGIMMRKDEEALTEIVDGTLARMYLTGEINAIYKKWFTTPTLNIPMNKLTRDSFTRPNREAGVAMLLGYSI
jgi:glutamate/aspartate transport system substrate-binding protein